MYRLGDRARNLRPPETKDTGPTIEAEWHSGATGVARRPYFERKLPWQFAFRTLEALQIPGVRSLWEASVWRAKGQER
jgi:hypothetical protein